MIYDNFALPPLKLFAIYVLLPKLLLLLPGEYDENDEEIITINDSTSFNWGFLSLESLPAYYEDLIYSGAINKFYADYCDIEDYATGFLATYNAVAELYNNAQNIDELTEAGISEMIDAKVDLYKKIEDFVFTKLLPSFSKNTFAKFF